MTQTQTQTPTNETKALQPIENQVVAKQNKAVDIWSDTAAYKEQYKLATVLAQSALVPQAYQNKPSECVIAMDMAHRMGLPPLMLMGVSQVIKGNFTLSGKAYKGIIDGCGLYKKSKYVMVGEKGTDSWGCYLEAVDNDGTIVQGVTVTIGMAKAEGWLSNSKWKSMPELMLRYRAASFFAKTECPNICMGFSSTEEIEDINPQTQRLSNPTAFVAHLDDDEEEGEN